MALHKEFPSSPYAILDPAEARAIGYALLVYAEKISN